MALIDDLKKDLTLNEGKKAFLYDDSNGLLINTGYCVRGNPTIGVGRALNKRPLSDNEIDYMLTNDCEDVIDFCNSFGWFITLGLNSKRAICNMVFQLGTIGFLKFTDMLKCLEIGDIKGAAKAALSSQWAIQTPNRAEFVTNLLVS